MLAHEASVVIPTLDRPQELDACLESLHVQTCQTFEIILLRERGPLARLRNEGLQRATAPVVCYLDDDTVCAPLWLERLLGVFRQSSEVMAVTGPALIPEAYKGNRPLLRSRRLLWLYDRAFVFPERRPGHLTRAGTFVPEPDYTYAGPVQFPEACNMAFRTEALKAISGFDESYGGIGDWSEPDAAFRLRSRYGESCIWFDPHVCVEHRPSRAGAYLLRGLDARQRLLNYELFAKRWVEPSWGHWVYQNFLRGYYGVQMVCHSIRSVITS